MHHASLHKFSSLQASRIHTCKRRSHLYGSLKVLWLRRGLHLLNDDKCANGDEITAVTVGESVVVHLVLQRAVGLFCTPVPRHGTPFKFVPMRLDEHQDSNIVFKTMLLSRLPNVFINDRPVEGRERELRARRNFENRFEERKQGDIWNWKRRLE